MLSALVLGLALVSTAAIAAPPDDAPHEPPGRQRPPDDTPQAREPGTPSGRGHDPFFQ